MAFVEVEYGKTRDVVWINTRQISEIKPWVDLPQYVRMSSGKRYGPLTEESRRRLKTVLECEARIEAE